MTNKILIEFEDKVIRYWDHIGKEVISWSYFHAIVYVNGEIVITNSTEASYDKFLIDEAKRKQEEEEYFQLHIEDVIKNSPNPWMKGYRQKQDR